MRGSFLKRNNSGVLPKMADQNWPVYGEITGPVVMIGFGSIGRGTLPLIERHFKFDKSRMTVIDPRDTDKQAARRARHRLRPGGA